MLRDLPKPLKENLLVVDESFCTALALHLKVV
jgi:hypothetical protein